VLTSCVVLMPMDATRCCGVPNRRLQCETIVLALLAPTVLRPPSPRPPVLVACGASTMTHGDPTIPSDSDPESPSTCTAQPDDSQPRDDDPSAATSLTPHLPLTAAINPIHRAFVPRLLPEHLDGHLRFPRALASSMRRLSCTGVAKALCAAILQRVEQFEVNHNRGAARRGLPAQFTMSAKVLAGVTHGARLGKPEAENKIGTPELSPTSSAKSRSPAERDHGTLCFHCRKPSTGPSAHTRPPTKIQVKPFLLPPLPRDWEKMVDAVQESWEKGLNGSPALKTLVSGSTTRADMASKKQLFGRVSSSMLSRRGAIAKAAAKSGGWSALRSVLRRERASRQRAGAVFLYNDVYKFCAALVSQSGLGC